MTRRRKPIRRQPATTVTGYDSWACPANPDHGRLVIYGNAEYGYCPHHDCNGPGPAPIWTAQQLQDARTT